jgi:hypothetical protein
VHPSVSRQERPQREVSHVELGLFSSVSKLDAAEATGPRGDANQLTCRVASLDADE